MQTGPSTSSKLSRARKPRDSDVPLTENTQTSCTTLDHVYAPGVKTGDRCYCGKKKWIRFIQEDYCLREGQYFQILPGQDEPVYRVALVNESRAHCVKVRPGVHHRSEDGASDLEEFQAGKGTINIGPRSAVSILTEEQVRLILQPKGTEMTAQTQSRAVSVPVAGKSTKDREQARRSSKDARVRANREAGIGVSKAERKLAGAALLASRAAKPKPERTVKPCACGCGEETTAYFAPGHDARFKGWLLKIEKGIAEPKDLMPKSVWSQYEWKKSGKGMRPTKNYKGEPYHSQL